MQWDRPLALAIGAQVLFTAQATGVVYNATVLNGQPNYQNNGFGHGGHGQGQVAVRVNWPFARDAGSLGTQVVEPIVQVIAAPQSGNNPRDNIPNEDSLGYEFTDSTLFALNRFGGYDRSEGGVRVNAALRGEWDFLGGQKLEGLLGASYQQHIDYNLYPQFQPYNGFDTGAHLSDVVGRVNFVQNKWLDFTARTRVDHRTGDIRFGDVISSFGVPQARFGVGYLYASSNPYLLYVQNFNLGNTLVPANPAYQIAGTPASVFSPRQEVRLNFSSHVGAYTLSASAIRDLETGALVDVGGNLKWENECTIFDVFFDRRFVSIAGDRGDTTIVFTLTLKSLGSINADG